MARHNIVQLYGQVAEDPIILKDDATGDYIRGMCKIIIIRGIRDSGNNIDNVKFDKPLIMTGNAEMIKEMENWKTNDMVEVKGAFTTKDIIKKTTCHKCGNKDSHTGTLAFISPIYLSLREKGLSEKEGIALLRKRCEISNQVMVIGNLTKDVDYYNDGKTKTATYQLAINRKFFLKDDSPATRTDYPFIRSFGEIASSDSKSLHQKSLILIDGMLQSREFERVTHCSNSECDSDYKWYDSTLEIVPYTVEYLQDFTTQEEIDSLREESIRKSQENILGDSISIEAMSEVKKKKK